MNISLSEPREVNINEEEPERVFSEEGEIPIVMYSINS